MKKSFIYLLITLFLCVLGLPEIRAFPNEQKVYVPDIYVTHDIDISHGLDALSESFDYTDLIGQSLLILYADAQGISGIINYKTTAVITLGYCNIKSCIKLINSNCRIYRYLQKNNNNSLKDYSLLGYSMRN